MRGPVAIWPTSSRRAKLPVMAVTEIPLDETALVELETTFRGVVVRPSDPTYDQDRQIWNGSVNRFPALIARCAGVADVIKAVRFGRQA